MPKVDNTQYYYDLESITEEILSFNLQYGDRFPRDIAKAMQSILTYFDTEQQIVIRDVGKSLR